MDKGTPMGAIHKRILSMTSLASVTQVAGKFEAMKHRKDEQNSSITQDYTIQDSISPINTKFGG